jgi:hypothetical protein
MTATLSAAKGCTGIEGDQEVMRERGVIPKPVALTAQSSAIT